MILLLKILFYNKDCVAGKVLCGILKYRESGSVEKRTCTLNDGCHGNGGMMLEITLTSLKFIVISEVTVFGHTLSKHPYFGH